MRLFDSNLLIYSAQEEYSFLRTMIRDGSTVVSAASKLETLGYHKLSDQERQYFEDIFEVLPVLAITNNVVDLAVNLRQRRRMSLGDCLIAATALLNSCTLYTRNTADFTHIMGLTVVNPIQG